MDDSPSKSSQEKMELLVPDSRVVILGEFINDIFIDISKPLTYLAQQSNEPITLYLSSPGGDALEGMAIVDLISRCRSRYGTEIHGVVLGQAMSAAAIILQACDFRIAYSHSVIMLHGPSVLTSGDAKGMEAEHTLMHLLIEQCLDLLESRTKRNRDYWKAVMDTSTPKYYTAQQALEEGLIDSIGDV